jgi:glycosyltransferase A (GT-A) superfamily protein (DUF2064 family)
MTTIARQSDCLLLIVARGPIPGETKTRLGKTIGMERAADLHRAFLADLASRFIRVQNGRRRYDFGWAYAPADYDFAAEMAEIAPRARHLPALYVPQCGDNFAARLMNLFRWSDDHGYQRTLILASDSPHLPYEYMPRGFELLKAADVVLGRVADGGYYVIGIRGVHEVVSPAVMSTADAASDLVAGAKAMGLKVGELPRSFDVDVEADLCRLITLLRSDPGAAPATWHALNALGLVLDAQMQPSSNLAIHT